MLSENHIIVVGYPKSGNTWLSRLLGDAMNAPVRGYMNALPLASEGHDRDSQYTVMQLHLKPVHHALESAVPNPYRFSVPKWNNHRIVHIIRDPRDVCVAVKYYWHIKDIKDAIMAVGEALPPVKVHGTWDKYVRDWSRVDEKMVVTTFYENLHANPAGHVEYILKKLNLKPVNDLEEVAQRQSIDARRKQLERDGEDHPYGSTIQTHNLRKGIVGDWRNEFNRTHAWLIEEYFGNMLEFYGYEHNREWWKEIAK
jgi:hypothetical protein